MVRFLYVNKNLVFLNGSFRLTEKNFNYDFYNDEKIISQFKNTKTYKDFLDEVKSASKNPNVNSFIIFTLKNELLVFNIPKTLFGNINPVCRYTYENTRLKDFFMKYFRTNNDFDNDVYHGKLITVGMHNYYNFICSRNFLDVILKYNKLVGDNIQVYRETQIPKKNGKMRKIVVPNESIKTDLRKLNKLLQTMFDKKNYDFQVAYKNGKSVKDNALIHKNKKYIFKLDIHDFFTSCTREIVKSKLDFIFDGCMNREYLLDSFLDAILYKDALFIGSPISGTLVNYIISNAVLAIKLAAEKNNMTFSIYSDDMTFGSDRFISETYVKNLVSWAFKETNIECFKLNEEKSIGQSKNRRHITGVSFNNEIPVISKKYYHTLRAMLYNLSTGKSNNIPVIKGKIGFAVQIEGLDYKVGRLLKNNIETVEKFGLLNKEKVAYLKNA